MTRAEELADFVCAAAALFYCAEEGHNPSVRTFWDALHYISTSLSVGYANIFPVTQAGKAIGAVVQMVGPALSSKALDPGALEGLLLPR
ncbi:MAG TPA: ion channel [Myxococcales bacterium]|nr:ion channel [Myxococcales bacterium]